ANAGIRAGSVALSNDRQSKLFGELHASKSFAIAFGMGQPEIALHLFLGILALVMTDEHNAMPAESRQPAFDGRIVAESSVAVQFAKLAADQLDIVLEKWALRVPSHLNRFPGAQIVVDFPQQRRVISAKLAKLLRIVDSLGLLLRLKQLDLLFDLCNRFLEFEEVSKLSRRLRARIERRFGCRV